MKKIILSLFVLTCLSSIGQTDIADARTYALGQTITISGIATNGSELGPIRYIQDGTAGMAAYGTSLNGIQRGDSLTVTGTLIEFSGLLEISPVTSVTDHGPAVVQPTALQIPITSAAETLESELVQIQNVTFVQSGNFAGNTTYQITDGSNTLDVRVNTGTNLVGTAIPSGPISITGPLGQFNTNYQVVPRDLNDIVTYVAPAFEINVKIEGNTVLSGSTYFIGNDASVSLVIENQGVSNLIISGHSFTGADAGDFSSDITPTSISGLASNLYTIDYTPSNIGSHFATLSIDNNDSDENPYIIYFEGVGTNNLATEPTSNPTGLSFSNVKAYTLSGQYNPGSGASKYLVLWKNGSAITSAPVDGMSYQRGDIVGDARVAYVGSGTSFTPRGIIANQNYFFQVYAFNGQGGFENYLLGTPASGSVSSEGEQIGNYYSGIDATASSFNTDLQALINPHTFITYFMYKQTMMNEFEVRDTTAGQSYVTCAYSGERKVFNDPFDWTPTGYSREHTFAHSWMPTYPADSPEEPEYTDQHHLYPTNLNNANTPRSNLPFGEIDGTVVYTFLDCTVGYAGAQLAFEPKEDQKGNVARSIFYMITSYDFPLNGNVNSQVQDPELLKDWHFIDLPDNYEIARNEYIYDLQGNRNPFIDSVDYVCYIDFMTNSHIPEGCGSLSIEEKLNSNFVVFPVPANEKVFVQVNGTNIISYELYDLSGKIVISQTSIDLPVVEMNTSDLSSGVYTINVTTSLGSVSKKLTVNN
jgi:endonuclease I